MTDAVSVFSDADLSAIAAHVPPPEAAAEEARQPVHVVYGGAHLFRADVAARLGARALDVLRREAPDFAAFARAVGLADVDGTGVSEAIARDPTGFRAERPLEWLAHAVYERVVAKLAREPIEDFRVDFEDGYGPRTDADEDADADRVAAELSRGVTDGSLPPFVGIRVKAMTAATWRRAVRTLERVLSLEALPDGFCVTLPKVSHAGEIEGLCEALERIEARRGYAPIPIELMVETPAALIDADGRCPLPAWVRAGRGRVRGAHLGTYDLTAGLGIVAAHQHHRHPAADLARVLLQAALADRVQLSDGATTVLPVGDAVVPAWRLHYANVRHSLMLGLYQGWDLHPAQLPARYAAVYAFFLEDLDAATARLRAFVTDAARARLTGATFDDAATGQGLLNAFLRAQAAGALTEHELLATGLTHAELQTRSFARILAGRG